MSTVTFTGGIGHIQRTLAECHEMILRRELVLQELNLRPGERVLEVGCGGGFYAFQAARWVGANGRVCAIDISPEQIAAAQTRCADFPWVNCKQANILKLPYRDGAFDAVYTNQVLEYISLLDRSLSEIYRVLRPGGRLIIVATNWSSLVWHSNCPQRMRRVLAAWDKHAPYPNLPVTLAAQLRKLGMEAMYQKPLPILNMSYNENSYSYWIARLIREFVTAGNLVPEPEALAWMDEFDNLEDAKAYFFSSMPVLTVAIK